MTLNIFKNKPVKTLKNPKTPAYMKFKELILSKDFPWFYNAHIYADGVRWDSHIKGTAPKNKINYADYYDHPWFSHTFLIRPQPERKYPQVNSPHLEACEKIIDEILKHNKIHVDCFYRINANLVLPIKGHKKGIPHLDHRWKHNLLFMYLTDAGGETVCVDNNLKKVASFDPPEDGVMLLKATNQLHYPYIPENKRRVIIIASHI